MVPVTCTTHQSRTVESHSSAQAQMNQNSVTAKSNTLLFHNLAIPTRPVKLGKIAVTSPTILRCCSTATYVGKDAVDGNAGPVQDTIDLNAQQTKVVDARAQ
jgi:hypothetical protein